MNTCKTPVSILHEYMQKRNLIPKYDLLNDSSGIGTNSPTFHYQVVAGSVRAIGIARSKKDAKHAAAKNALEQLAQLGEIGVLIPGYQALPQPAPGRESPNISEQVNYVGCLQELCTEKGIPQPDIRLIADVGLPHDRRFTMECHVANLIERATETTKKKAKQSCAQKMLHRLMDSLPDEIEIPEAPNESRDLVPMETLIHYYNENSYASKHKINWGMKICEFPTALSDLLVSEQVTVEEFFKDVSKRDYNELQEVFKKVKVQISVEFHKNEEPYDVVALLRIKMYPELVFIGISTTEESSLAKAVFEAFDCVESLVKY